MIKSIIFPILVGAFKLWLLYTVSKCIHRYINISRKAGDGWADLMWSFICLTVFIDVHF
ncbi:MAG: hypothetical protein Q4G33_14390 [bacterium]|nr:hypothetical protein [bacterium]